MNKLETLKKKIIYRANYRGTKEMDILLSNFVKRHIDEFDLDDLNDLDKLLSADDEEINKWYLKPDIRRIIHLF